MTERQIISTETVWESLVGYSRAVRIGNVVEVAGTTSIDDGGNLIGVNDAAEQTRFIIKKIEQALLACGANLTDVIRTRIYVTNIALWESIGKAHGEFFKDIRPASTMVEVHALVDPRMLVEIEASAVIQG